MNYLRGAVNAISAPYQYYKDLPPINPSTLTGAIDVIVVQRPADTGDTELVCSPFHVRFGKWQVLRPGEKLVNISVNGHPIPFKMKIGEAGEAFFVFEIEGDVPEDLITSPLLQPTRPDEALQNVGGVTSLPHQQTLPSGPDIIHEQTPLTEELATQEPEFLDLDALPSPPPEDVLTKPNHTLSVHPQKPQVTPEVPAQSLPSPPSTPTLSSEMEQDIYVDEAINLTKNHLDTPKVEYYDGIALDAEGYHSHNRERSDRTVRPSEHQPLLASYESRSEGLHFNVIKPSEDVLAEAPVHSFPLLRATSEPPPDGEQRPRLHITSASGPQASASELNPLTPVQEYSWEWGAFPQPSPIKQKFGSTARTDVVLGSRTWGQGKGKEKAEMDFSELMDDRLDLERKELGVELEHGRSRSVPPGLDGSPARDRKGKPLFEGERYSESEEQSELPAITVMERDTDGTREELTAFGKGGKLGPSKTDPTRFILKIEERRVAFEVSMALLTGEDGAVTRTHDMNIFDGRDEVEAARIFSRGKVDFERFLDDEDVVNSPNLVIRWADNRYITRTDGSPLMDALVLWREAALRQASRLPIRPTSPLSEDEEADSVPPTPPQEIEEDKYHYRSTSEPPEPRSTKPTSLSWVQWWSRSKKTSRAAGDADLEKGQKPTLENSISTVQKDNDVPSPRMEGGRLDKEIPPAESAPTFPSSPIQLATTEIPTPTPAQAPPSTRKYAKTLRLTSDQLKVLNLKSGANTITFSLSTSGAIACTARIFMWDSADLVVVSDIDGTITKSDGLGHVFAMIGRDWTHLGVAKLYTDINRNGYKIMYLTSRAIGQADATRDYLKGIRQNNYQLPEGPVIMSPDRLMASLHREVIMRKPEVFKMACLRDIQRLFGEASRNPFYAGFGNRITDALSYRSVNVPSARIFTIDSSGEVKLELLKLAGYKSSYIYMTDLVDQMFPPIHRKWMPEYTDFNYWKQPLQDFPLPDLSPPSPTLSARSDTSQGTLARLKNFSLVGSRQTPMRSPHDEPRPERGHRDPHLRQMSSFERLRDTLGFSQTADGIRSASPESTSYDSEDEEWEADDSGKRRRRERRRSMTSMPGTLDERHFDEDEEGEYFAEGEGGYRDEDVVDDGGDETFDEDLLAAGEMRDVPFL